MTVRRTHRPEEDRDRNHQQSIPENGRRPDRNDAENDEYEPENDESIGMQVVDRAAAQWVGQGLQWGHQPGSAVVSERARWSSYGQAGQV